VLAWVLAAAFFAGTSRGEEVEAAVPTFTRDVAPILFQHCVRCHRADGSMADFPLSSYRSVTSKLQEVRDKVSRREMPPWPADPAASLPFSNDPTLARRDIDTIVAWIDAGAPQGDAADLPPEPTFASGWSHPDGRAPDAVVTLPRFTLAANGEVPYQERLIKLPFEDDRWLSAIEVRAGNPRILHHMGITEVRLPEGLKPENLSALDTIARHVGAPSGRILAEKPAVEDPQYPGSHDMVGVYTPGTTFENYGADFGKLLKGGKNVYLNFNIHYTTSGREETDVSRLALWFEPRPPSHLLIRAPAAVDAIMANGRQLLTDDPGTKAEGTAYALPPIGSNDSHYELIGMTAFTHAVTIHQLQPHAHVRARDFLYRVVYPDGREVPILSVPRYRYHFQLAYALKQPLILPAGSKLVVVAHYDNSPANPELQHLGSNMAAQRCGPDNVAYFGQQNQSWDEMFSPFIQYADGTPDVHPVKDLHLVTAVGCLVAGRHGWMLERAAEAKRPASQGMSFDELAAAARTTPGAAQYRLIGIEQFSPAERGGSRVAVNGVLIPRAGGAAINVTSMYPTPSACR
jgi:mono/diheme cytochrome c family protein